MGISNRTRRNFFSLTCQWSTGWDVDGAGVFNYKHMYRLIKNVNLRLSEIDTHINCTHTLINSVCCLHKHNNKWLCVNTTFIFQLHLCNDTHTVIIFNTDSMLTVIALSIYVIIFIALYHLTTITTIKRNT